MKGLGLICLLYMSNMAWCKDTIFLKRQIADTPYAFYHAIYIEKDTGSAAWKSVLSFAFSKYDSILFAEQKKKIGKLKRPIAGLPEQPLRLVPLYLYNGAYYLYRPSDLYHHYRFELNNRYLLDFSGEGPYPNKVKNFTRLSDKHWVIYRSEHGSGSRVDLEWVDKEKGIVVLSFSKSNAIIGKHKILMIAIEQAWRFPMIVNYCLTDKQHEFEFDEIDFTALRSYN